MPLMIAKIGSERTLEELARGVFKLKKRGSDELVRRAQEALLRANPQLARPEGFKAGGAIVVPEVAGLQPSDRTRANDAESAAAALDPIEEGLKELARGAAKSFEAAGAGAEATLKSLGSKRFRAALKKEAPELEPRLSGIEEKAKERARTVKERASAVEKALARAIEDIGSLRNKLG